MAANTNSNSACFDPNLKALLDRYGISEEVAAYAGIFGVENAQRDLKHLAKDGAAFAVRHHDEKSAHVANSGGRVIPYYPRVRNFRWSDVLNNPGISLVVTDDHLKALKLCSEGTPAIAVVGVSKDQLANWLSSQGADVIVRRGALH